MVGEQWPFLPGPTGAPSPVEVQSARDLAARRLGRLTAAGLLLGITAYLGVTAVGAVERRLSAPTIWVASPTIVAMCVAVLAGLPARLGPVGSRRAYQAFPVVVAATVFAAALTGPVTPVFLVAGAGLLALAGALGGWSLAAAVPLTVGLPLVALQRGDAHADLVIGTLAVYLIVAITLRALDTVLVRALVEAVAERDRAQRLAWQLEAVARGARAVTTLQVDDVMQAVAETATATDWQSAALYLVEPSMDRLRMVGRSNVPADLGAGGVGVGEGLAGRAVAGGRTVTTDDYSSWSGRLPEPGGEQLHAAAATPIHVDGQLVGAIAVARTDRRAIDQGSLVALELLAAQAGRALELSARDEQQLAVIDELRRVEKSQGDFLSAVSHEVRTPVTVLIGATETLVERWEGLSEEQRRNLVRQAHLNAHALKRLVTSLLDSARLREGVLTVRQDEVGVWALLHQTVERLRSLVGDQTVVVEADDALVVKADPDLLGRVVENLLTNALKYAGAQARIRVGGEAIGDAVRIFVADDGPGMSDEDVVKLGRRFYRGDRDDDVPGIGLGLAFCKRVLERHDSELRVLSVVGQGTTFAFELPLMGVVHD